MRGSLRPYRLLVAVAVPFFVTSVQVRAGDPGIDFSGKWVLDTSRSEVSALGRVATDLAVSQGGGGILCSSGTEQWSYALDGSETRKQVGGEFRNSVVKWEGAALLVNTQVTGSRQYTVMDRWELTRSRNTLSISRQVVSLNGEVEGTLVFRREGEKEPAAQAATAAGEAPAAGGAPAGGWHQTEARSAPPPTLAARPAPRMPADYTILTGTRVLLSLTNEISTKHAKDGDRVYLRTAAPVTANNRVVIPRGSDVEGTITHAKPAGKVVGKGELFIRFDTLILPNGVSRDFRARPPGEEGKVEGNGKAADGRVVMAGAGMGATIGAITHGLGGAAVGGVGGALAGVLLSRNQDVVLRSGTHVEMVLDRDLVFHPEELP